MADPSISVAMCTYNSERFLGDQLESLRCQSRQPDELVVSDDGSTDGTFDILNEFASRVPFEVRLVRHTQNVGPWKNFEQAVFYCSKDIVFLSDHDDVWHEHKIDLMSRELISRPSAGGAFSDAEIVESDLSRRGCSVWELIDFTPERQARYLAGEAFAELLDLHTVQAASLAFWAHHRSMMLPFGSSWPHDSWTSIIVAACSDLIPINQRLMKWRQHDRNALGAPRADSRSRLRRRCAKWFSMRPYYREKLSSLDAQLTQLRELQVRLEAQATTQRFEHSLAALMRRQHALADKRRRAVWKLGLLCDFSERHGRKNA